MNLKYIMLSEKRQALKITYCMFPFYDILEKAVLRQKIKSCYWGKGLTMKRQCKRIWRVMELFYILVVVEVIQLYASVKTHRTIHQKKNEFFFM